MFCTYPEGCKADLIQVFAYLLRWFTRPQMVSHPTGPPKRHSRLRSSVKGPAHRCEKVFPQVWREMQNSVFIVTTDFFSIIPLDRHISLKYFYVLVRQQEGHLVRKRSCSNCFNQSNFRRFSITGSNSKSWLIKSFPTILGTVRSITHHYFVVIYLKNIIDPSK